jgi:hypothetical protein
VAPWPLMTMPPMVADPVNWINAALEKPPGTRLLLLVIVIPVAPAPVLFNPNAGSEML